MSFELSDPPVVTPAGKYVVIVDQYGYTRALERPTNRALLAFDGDDFYWVDGTDALPLVLNNLKVANELSSLNGVVAQNAGGRAYRLVNESSTKKIYKSQGGLAFLEDDTTGSSGIIPSIGSGVLVQNPAGTPLWLTDNGIVYVNNAQQPVAILNGNAGQVLRMSGGAPSWGDLPSGNIAGGSGSIGLEGVSAAWTSLNTINIKAPVFELTDLNAEIKVSAVDINLNIAGAVGLLGLDTGTEDPNKWYYGYIISDGVDVSGIISDDPISPDLGVTGYTHWGLATVFRNDAAGGITRFIQRGRRFSTSTIQMTLNGTITNAWASVPQTLAMGNIVPPNVKAVSGAMGGSTNATTNRRMAVASSIDPIGIQFIDFHDFSENEFHGFLHGVGSFHDVMIADPATPAIYWMTPSAAGDTKRRVMINGYTI